MLQCVYNTNQVRKGEEDAMARQDTATNFFYKGCSHKCRTQANQMCERSDVGKNAKVSFGNYPGALDSCTEWKYGNVLSNVAGFPLSDIVLHGINEVKRKGRRPCQIGQKDRLVRFLNKAATFLLVNFLPTIALWNFSSITKH